MTVMNGKHVVFTASDFGRLKLLVQSRQTRAAEGRMATTLEAGLAQGQVVPPSTVAEGTVTMRSKVRVKDTRSGQRMTYTLVYPEEADIEAGRISVLAPIGAAILGASEGQVVECATPGGLRRLRIERVLYQPEAAGDYEP